MTETGSNDVIPFHTIQFGRCPEPLEYIANDDRLCQSVPPQANIDVYVNLLSRRPDQFNLRNSTELRNFVTANELVFRFHGNT